jgi:hypothetical protein
MTLRRGVGSARRAVNDRPIKGQLIRSNRSFPRRPARISMDGRLTLVIHEGSAYVQTYYALSGYEMLDASIDNLRKRESTPKRLIHCLLSSGEVYRGDGENRNVPDGVRREVGTWLARKPELSAAVWTGLESNWKEKRSGKTFSVDDAVIYTRELEQAAKQKTGDDRRKAEIDLNSVREYVRNTPAQVQTAVRKRLSAQPEWADAALSHALFDSE